MPFYKISKSFLLLLFWFHTSFAQNFPGKNYSAANDLPNNTVRDLLLDSNNNLWIGTDNGIVKKQNDVFESFFEEDGLALNSCWAIAEDKNKKIWFGSYGGGISIYDGRSFKIISKKDGLIHNEITRLYPFQNYMLVGTSDGISIIDIYTLKITSLKTASENDLLRVQDFFEYQGLVYAVLYDQGIFSIEFRKQELKLIKVKKAEKLYSTLLSNDSIYVGNKEFFIKTSLEDYFLKDDSVSENKLGFSIIWDYATTKDDQIFAAAWGIYDNSGGIYEIVQNKMISRSSDFNIPSDEVISLAYDDLFEKLYVGTRDQGLFEVRLNSEIKFHEIQNKNVLGFAHTQNISAILLDDGMILKGNKTENKISLEDLKSWQQDYISNTKIPLPKYEDGFYELEYGIPAEDIKFYDLKTLRKTFWLNTNIGIFAIAENGKLERYVPLHSEEINFTEDGNFVETHPYGGVRIYKDLDTFRYSEFKKEDSLTPTMVVNSLRTDHKTYFLSVFSGLYTLENNRFNSYLKNGIWKEEKLRHITPFGKDLAISNEFGDIFIVNDNSFFQVKRKIPRAEIRGNTIYFLKEYQGQLLIGTEKGLTIFKNERSIILDEEQGLKQPFLSADITKNLLSLGTENGYYSINLDSIITTKNLVNNLGLKEVFINNKKITGDVVSAKEKINLEHDENTVLLKFSTNAHPYPKKLGYQYRLHADDNWSLPSSSPEIFLPFLPSGNYEVFVKVLDASTGLDHTQSLTKLSIKPPYWRTWWFTVFVISVLLFIIFGIYRYQLNQYKKFEAQKRLIQKRFEETKMEALLAQMNPHFIFNAMNSIQNYIMDSDINNASIFLGDFAKLIRLNLDHCTKPTILLEEEIEYLRSYIRVENTRYNEAIRVIFDIDKKIDTYDVEVPTMILQTFVENVFVHAFPSGIYNPTLKISFSQLSTNMLRCKIEDNGIGISENSNHNLHQSKGVNLVKERLELLDYDVEKTLQINSIKNKGTSVTIDLVV